MPLSGTTTHCVVDIIRRHFPRRRHDSLLRQPERYRDTQPEVSPMGIKTHITYDNCANAFSLLVLAKNQIRLKLFIACMYKPLCIIQPGALKQQNISYEENSIQGSVKKIYIFIKLHV